VDNVLIQTSISDVHPRPASTFPGTRRLKVGALADRLVPDKTRDIPNEFYAEAFCVVRLIAVELTHSKLWT
jgi:hypothetical protein